MRPWVAVGLWLQLGFGPLALADEPPAGAALPPPATTTTTSEAERRQRSIIEAYERAEAETRAPQSAPEDSHGFGVAFLQMLLVLGGVVAMAYLLLAKFLPKLMRIEPPTAPRRLLTVVDRLPLDQRRSIMVLKMAGQYFLIGAGEGGIELLSRLDAAEVERALAQSEANPRAPLLDSLFGKKPPKEGAPS